MIRPANKPPSGRFESPSQRNWLQRPDLPISPTLPVEGSLLLEHQGWRKARPSTRLQVGVLELERYRPSASSHRRAPWDKRSRSLPSQRPECTSSQFSPARLLEPLLLEGPSPHCRGLSSRGSRRRSGISRRSSD